MFLRTSTRVALRPVVALATASALVLAACSGSDTKPPVATVAPSTTVVTNGEPGTIGLRVEAPNGVATSAELTVDWTIGASVDADEMQLTTDASFTTAVWQPYQSQATVTVPSTGYQTLFGRIRTATGDVLSTATGVTIDADWSAATSGASGAQSASWAALVAPNVLQVRIETGRAVRGPQEPYDFEARPDGDELSTNDQGVTVVVRDGTPLGQRVGDLDVLKRWDVVLGSGSSFPADLLDDAAGFALGGVAPASVGRVTRPTGEANTPSGQAWPVAHDVFLTFAQPVPTGTPQQLTFPGGSVTALDVTLDPRTNVSPAVHVNQVGYRPADTSKKAFLSTWMGSAGGITYAEATPFDVVDDAGETVLSGTSTLFTPPKSGEWGKGDLTGAPVHTLDLSSLNTPGRYRVCVAGIGCSFAFLVGEDNTWLQTTIGVARSMYHQRSNAVMGPPYTSIVRPVGDRSAGMTAERVSLGLLDNPADVGVDDRFEEYPLAVTGEVVEGINGGHFDAGDWNMRIQHLRYLRVAIDLVELFPERFANLELNIPESGDEVPDLVDEGLWDLDLYLSLQSDDGGVAGLVDYGSFPARNEASWQNDSPTYVLSPDPWSSYLFTAAAADASRLLADIDATRASTYAFAASRAMAWAETQSETLNKAAIDAIDDVRGTAAAAMLRLTGDDRWNDVFIDATTFEDGPVDLLGCLADDGCDAAWTYARAGATITRPDVFSNVLESFKSNAEALVSSAATTAYGWSLEHPEIPLVFGLGPATPRGVGLLRADVLLGDRAALAAATDSASFSLGANPMNTSFITGFGTVAARNPLIADVINGGSPAWPGTPVFGPHDLSFGTADDWITNFRLSPAGTEPSGDTAPYLWSYYDLGGLPPMNEFTIARSHAAALWAFGVLAAQDLR